jgi:hypothetical protein
VKDSSQTSEDVSLVLLKALIPIGRYMLNNPTLPCSATQGDSGSSSPTTSSATGSGAMGFPQLMVVMATLAGAGRSGRGHVTLFEAALDWLILCKSRIGKEDLLNIIRSDAASNGESENSNGNVLESMCFLLSYVGEILGALKLGASSSKSEKESNEGSLDLPAADWFMGPTHTGLNCAHFGTKSDFCNMMSIDTSGPQALQSLEKLFSYFVYPKGN